MDWQLIIDALKNAVNFMYAEFVEYTSTFNEMQWMLLISGSILVTLSLYAAWKAFKPMKYKIALMFAKLGLIMIVLAFAWPCAVDLYNTALQLTGNPLTAVMFVVLGGFIGYNTIKMILTRGEKK